ncbi:hypothetical protein L1049_012209 [Liquidambar formosana]|uniref:Uncharacterized protein n=1 Tax=Liquidambar formosana TaxID=63359 RepID=A0AAP0RYR1_LIQFO
MGIKEIGLSLMLFCHLCLLAAPSPRHNTFPSVLLQENNIKDIEKDKNSKSGSNIGGSGIVRRNSVSHRGGAASASGGHGGRSSGTESGTGDHGNNGDSTNPTTAGTAVIPIYAAGAANGHRPNNHKSAGSRTRNCLGLPTLGAAILATLALHVNVEFWI